MRKRYPSVVMILASSALAVSATACGSSSGGGQVAASAKQTITFAISGLGAEGKYTKQQVSEFEAKHPNITVKVLVDSSDSTTFLSQIENSFHAGSGTPDMVESDITYTAKWAAAGYLKPVSCKASDFNQSMISTGMYNGKLYSCPWFLNVEGLWYRTDLVPTPPTTPQQVITDAQAAMKADSSLKEGIAFEGDKYEGAITVYMMLDRAFGGSMSKLSHINTPQNVAALNYLHSLIYQYKLAPSGVASYQEGQTGSDFASGYAAFATNWPYVAGLKLAPSVQGHIGFIPFPAASGGKPGVALGGEVLSVNAKSTHVAAVNELISFLTSTSQESQRGAAVADAPAVPAAYTPALFSKQPVFKTVQSMAPQAAARPVTPYYLNVSNDLQELISSAYANSSSGAAAAAFTQYAPKVASSASGSAS